MKPFKVLLFAACLIGPLALTAAEETTAGNPSAPRTAQRPNRTEIIRQFDKNGDGVIDENERKAARETLQKQNQPRRERTADDPTANPEWMKRFDKNGDGVIDQDERKAAREQLSASRTNNPSTAAGQPTINRAAIVNQFDKDGDGRLSESEREAAMKAVRDRLQSASTRMPRESLIKRFDKNGDGIIDDEERKAARESLANRQPNGESATSTESAPAKKEPAPAATESKKD